MNKVTSITIASVEKYFQTKIHLTEHVVAVSGGLANDVLHGQCAAEENTRPFDREWDCGIVKLKGVGGKEGQLLSCSDEHCFCLSTI